MDVPCGPVVPQYAGICNVGLGADEVVLLFCNKGIDPGIVRVESKVALSLKNAKRLAAAMNNLISRYEAANGVIELAKNDKESGR